MNREEPSAAVPARDKQAEEDLWQRHKAETVLEKLREWMAGAGLTLHPDKTRTVDMTVADSHFDFLGYRFKRSRNGVNCCLESRMREIRTSGSEGGAGRKPRSYLYLALTIPARRRSGASRGIC